MKTVFHLISSILVVAAISAVASATPRINIDQTRSASGDNFAFFLDTGNLDNKFNVFIIEMLPDAPNSFLNYDANGADGTSW